MNNFKKYIPIIFCLLITCAGFFGIYKLHIYVSSFSGRVVEINRKLKELDKSKQDIEYFKKILSKGSKEQTQIDQYILSSKDIFKTITDIEKIGKKSGVFESIHSVTKRDNLILKDFNADEVVVNIMAEGDKNSIDLYLEALTNLPFVSYVEKVSLNFSENKTKADITIVITEII